MHDLINRLKRHPNDCGLIALRNQPPATDNYSGCPASDQWFYLLNTPPRSFTGPKKTRVFESPLHASDWIGQNFRNSGLQQGMALSFNLPFPNKEDTLSCVPPDPASIQKYIDFMVKEIQLLSDSVAEGTSVPYLHWFSDVVKLLTPSELTQLMFHIDRSFKILRLKSAKLVFELSEEPESEDRIALMAGLGFNTVCINDPTAYLTSGTESKLLEWLDLIRSFNINNIYIRLDLPDIDNSVLANIEKIIGYSPSGILLSRPANPQTSNDTFGFNKVRQQLTKGDYPCVGNNFFVRQNINKQPITPCLKGIGLGAVSYTQTFRICNTRKLDDYYSQLSSGRLPVKSVTELIHEI